MRKLAFRYRRIKEIYTNYQMDLQSIRTTIKANSIAFPLFRFTWTTKIRRITSITFRRRKSNWLLAYISFKSFEYRQTTVHLAHIQIIEISLFFFSVLFSEKIVLMFL